MSTATLQIKVDSTKAKREIDRMDDSLEKLDRQAKTTGRTLKSFGSAAKVALLAGSAAAVLLGRSALKASEELDKIAKTARGIGITTDALQTLRFAGEQSGIAVSEMDKGLEFLVRSMGEATLGTGKLKDVMEEYNISLTDSQGKIKPVEGLMMELADAYQTADSAAEKALISTAAFGRAGVKMGNLLQEGAAGVKSLTDEARDLGLVIDEKVLNNAEDMNDALNRSSEQMRVMAQVILVQIVPAIVTMANAFVTAFNKMQEIFSGLSQLNDASLVLELSEEMEILTGKIEDQQVVVDKAQKAYDDLTDKQSGQAIAYAIYLERQKLALDDLWIGWGDLSTRYDTATSSGKLTLITMDEITEAAKGMGLEITVATDALEAFGGAGRDVPEFGPWEKEVEDTTENITTIWDNMVENIQRAWGDAFYDLFKKGKVDFKDLVDTIWDMFLRLLADMAAKWAVSSIFGGIAGAAGASGAVGTALFGAGGFQGVMASLGKVGAAAASAVSSVFGGGAAAAAGNGFGGGATGALASGGGGAAAGGSGISLASISPTILSIAPLAALAAYGFYQQSKNKAERDAITAASMLVPINEAVSTTEALFRGLDDATTGFTQSLNVGVGLVGTMGTDTDILAEAMRQFGVNVEFGQDGVLKLSGNMAEAKAITAAFNDEAAAGLRKQIELLAKRLAAQDDGIIRAEHMDEAIKQVTADFGLSVLQAQGLRAELEAIPTHINTTHTITTTYKGDGGGGGDSFAKGTGGYRTVPYDGYSPVLHKGEQFNVIPANKVGDEAQHVQDNGQSGAAVDLLERIANLMGRQVEYSESTSRSITRAGLRGTSAGSAA